jgi:hypothetical protein
MYAPRRHTYSKIVFLFLMSLVPRAAGANIQRESAISESSESPDGEDEDSEEGGGSKAPKRATGDEAIGGQDSTPIGGYTFRSLIQTRFRQTFVDVEPMLDALARQKADELLLMPDKYLELLRQGVRENDGIRLNRAFLRAIAQPTQEVGFKLLLDFAELTRQNVRRTIKLAFTELTPHERVTVTAGLFKIPFSLLELLPIADFEFAEVGPTDALIKNLGFAGRDIGAMVRISPLARKRHLSLFVGAFQGENTGDQEYRGPGMLAGRVTSRPIKRLRLGANAAWRPHAVDAWRRITRIEHRYPRYASGMAYGGDVSFRYKKLELRAEALKGDRTDLDANVFTFVRFRRGVARTFLSTWALAAYRIRVGKVVLQPAVRAEWLDLDREHPVGELLYLTAALGIDFSERVRLLFDVSHTDVQPGTVNREVPRIFLYDADNTTFIVQLQLKL